MSMERFSSRRVIYYDILRIAAICFVVAVHLSAQHWLDVDVSSRAWFAFNLYCTTGKWSVPVFVMISGALFLRRELDIRTILKKYLLRIAIAFAFWSAAYALFVCALYGITWDEVLFRFFTGHYHMWFLFMIAGLYLLIPLLRPIVQSEKLMRYFLLLAFIFTFLLPQAAFFCSFALPQASEILRTVIQRTYCYFPLGLTVYFIGGYYLSRREFSRREETVLYCIGAAALLFSIAAPVVLSRAQGAPSDAFYNYNSLNVLFTSVPIFVFAKQHLNFPKMGERSLGILGRLSKYSFGVYLVHPMVIELLGRFGIDTFSCNAFFSVPLLAVIVFAASMAVSALLHQIPVVKKYIV